MDALRMLEFPAASFDLANLRLGVSFMRTWDWPTVLIELLRVTRPDGIVRLTESNIVQQSNSPALTQLCQMLQCALFRAGHLFTNESTGLTDHLARLLDQYGCKQIQTKAYAIEYRPGMAEGQARYKDLMLAFQTGYPFIQKWGCASQDYEAIHQQALNEIRQPDFHSTWKMFTFWGSKPRPKPKSFHQ
jgi:ubiquinone/menaquinone biosynthesis C-methylase UbiE